jgi:starvation-inducible outer membrane lipoprotein
MRDLSSTGKVMAVAFLSLAPVACQQITQAKPEARQAGVSSPFIRATGLELGGKVIRVNREQRYIVAECAVLPNSSEEARVFRGEHEVGRVRFSGPFSSPYAVADVVEGQPVVGDRIRK